MIIFSFMEIKSVSWRESSDRFERHKQIQWLANGQIQYVANKTRTFVF